MNIDAHILRSLRENSGSVSGADLSQKLGISRAAIWARIEELRRLGYDIEASPHLGYRLVNSPDLLHSDDLVAQLPVDRVVGREIRVFQETSSTNDIAERMALDGVPEGMVVFAESQTKGRGRLGRSWVSPVGKGLWFSVLLRPVLRPQAATQFTIAAATALARGIESETGVRPSIKWPNDILIGGKKVAGVLTELNAEVDRIRFLVLGIGINVNFGARDFPSEIRPIATSLQIETGGFVRRASLAAAVLRELDKDYAKICAGKFADLVEEWQARCSTLGKNVTIQIGDRRVRGRAEALDSEGALLLRTEHGRLERIIGGDVSIEK